MPPLVDRVSLPDVLEIVYPLVLPIVTSTKVVDDAYIGSNTPLAVATKFQVPPSINGAPDIEPDVSVNAVTVSPLLTNELSPILESIVDTGAQNIVSLAVLSV